MSVHVSAGSGPLYISFMGGRAWQCDIVSQINGIMLDFIGACNYSIIKHWQNDLCGVVVTSEDDEEQEGQCCLEIHNNQLLRG